MRSSSSETGFQTIGRLLTETSERVVKELLLKSFNDHQTKTTIDTKHRLEDPRRNTDQPSSSNTTLSDNIGPNSLSLPTKTRRTTS